MPHSCGCDLKLLRQVPDTVTAHVFSTADSRRQRAAPAGTNCRYCGRRVALSCLDAPQSCERKSRQKRGSTWQTCTRGYRWHRGARTAAASAAEHVACGPRLQALGTCAHEGSTRRDSAQHRAEQVPEAAQTAARL